MYVCTVSFKWIPKLFIMIIIIIIYRESAFGSDESIV